MPSTVSLEGVQLMSVYHQNFELGQALSLAQKSRIGIFVDPRFSGIFVLYNWVKTRATDSRDRQGASRLRGDI